MQNTKTVRMIGWIQVTFGGILAIAGVVLYLLLHEAVTTSASTVAESLSAVSSALATVGEAMTTRRDLLDDAKKGLEESRKLVEAIEAGAKTHGKSVSSYAANAESVATWTIKLGTSLLEAGEKLRFSMPTQMTWSPPKTPQIVYSRPMEKTAASLTSLGHRAEEIGKDLSAAARFLSTDVPRMNIAIVKTAQKSTEVLRDMEEALSRLSPKAMEDAIAKLKESSHNVKQASELARNVRIVIFALLIGVVGLSLLLAANGVALLVLAYNAETVARI